MNLYELNHEWETVFNMLEDGEIDDKTIFDTIESIEADIDSKADGYGKIIRMLQGNILVMEEEIKRLQARKSTLDNRIKALKSNLQSVMENIGKPRIQTDIFTFSITKNPPSVKIEDGAEIPEEYQIPQPFKVDKAKIKEDLKNGKKLDWAKIEQGTSLRIK